jgi:hypothetical protein
MLTESEIVDSLESKYSILSFVTLNCVIDKGPFAGPFIVSVRRYTGAFRTKYFWNGHRVYKHQLHIVGREISERRLTVILSALKEGCQFDNSTVPMILLDMVSGLRRLPLSEELEGEATTSFLRKAGKVSW